jgi:7,8-dihydroneopterin aldolase/epimerase/oxygenase
MTSAASDRVALLGLRGRGRHGWFAHETENGQLFQVDVVLHLDTRPAAASDDLVDTVDYGEVGRAVLAVVEGEPVRLIETLAQRVADACLVDPRVEVVEVVVHKPEAPMAVPFDDIEVRIVRGRA